MYEINVILEKLNTANRNKTNNSQRASRPISLLDIMICSFAELQKMAGDTLGWGEIHYLWVQAQQVLKQNKMTQSRILSHANPQLANAIRLGIRSPAGLRSYDDWFPQFASKFANSGSVASMFSPAGYLTELYREAKNLHPVDSLYNLDTRRPDLASMVLSQSNMNDELSTLSLSNSLLIENIRAQEDISDDELIEMFCSYREVSATPYHQPYESVRQAILLQDPELTIFRDNPAVVTQIDPTSLLSLMADVSPELFSILTEEITEADVAAQIKKNFGDIALSTFQSMSNLARWYDLTIDEINELAESSGLVIFADNLTPGVQYYANGQLVTLLAVDGLLEAVMMTRSAGGNYSQFGYIELLPLAENRYRLQFTVTSGHVGPNTVVKIGTKGAGAYDLVNNGRIPGLNEVFSQDVELVIPPEGILIGVTRYNPDGSGSYYYADVKFKRASYPFEIYLLKLNKLLRLYKATGISLSEIRTMISDNGIEPIINAETLYRLFWIRYYMKRLRVDDSEALVLAGGTISQLIHRNQPSSFTRLFNTPMLDNKEFVADGAKVSLMPNEDEISDTFRTGVIKRAFGVNDTELCMLWSLARGGRTTLEFEVTVANLSQLYYVRLLASVCGLSVNELALLISVSPYSGLALGDLSGMVRSEFINYVISYVQWLYTLGWGVTDLYLMTTDRYSTVMTPDIENLLLTLKNGIVNQESDDTGSLSSMAPLFASALQLASSESAESILLWADQLKPADVTLSDFLSLINKEALTSDELVRLVSFCQVLGQLALFVNHSGISAATLSWAVTHPAVIDEQAKTLAQNPTTMYELTELESLLKRSGNYASQIVSSLSGDASAENNLATSTVAVALNLNEVALRQAQVQVSARDSFYSWPQLRDALQWLNASSRLGISPSALATLTRLTPASSFADWVAASHVIQAGLNVQQSEKLKAAQDESLSAALSAYVIKNSSLNWVTDRDSLWSWLLIDNQISAQIKTTRIAEAIASVQLYVNHALIGREEGVVNEIKAKPFFSNDWDIFNKRYSTWAGVSQLVYYPENYIDPTMRTGQTDMMDEMLQSLSQSQLSSDKVEDTFKTYMTRFEAIANLNIVSGYHDSISDQNGITYIIGCSSIGDYYWRSVDIGKLTDGKLPANAWMEWKKITAPVSPVNNLVRPVIYQSRLYLVWIESRETATIINNTTTNSVGYLLKYAHIQHDGTWSAPATLSEEKGILPLDQVEIEETGMYCARDMELEKLYIFFYKKAESYSGLPTPICGITISATGDIADISDNEIFLQTGYIFQQLDTTTEVRLNTPYAGGDVEVRTFVSKKGSTPGDLNLTKVDDGGVNIVKTTLVNEGVEISFSAHVNVFYDVYFDLVNPLSTAIVLVGKEGDVFYIPKYIAKGHSAPNPDKDYVLFAKKAVNDESYQYFAYQFSGFPIESGNSVYGTVSDNYNDITFQNSPQYCSKFTKYMGANDIWINSNNRELNINKDSDFAYLVMASDSNPERLTTMDYLYYSFRKLYSQLDIENIVVSIPEAQQDFHATGKSTNGDFDADFSFGTNSITLPLSIFSSNTAEVTFKISANPPVGDFRQTLGSLTYLATLTRVIESAMPIISLNRTAEGAQYLQYGVYRIRVNTLFARQLVARANAGLDMVLSMETQHLQEPILGEGVYVKLLMSAYNALEQGDSHKFTILTGNDENYPLSSGMLDQNKEVSVQFFLPWTKNTEATDNNYLYLAAQYQKGKTDPLRIIKNDAGYTIDNTFNNGSFSGLKNIQLLTDNQSEPMDFAGANALYFWEMFYYVPMMVFKRLMSEGKFTEATRWIKYVWNPNGYFVNDQAANYLWNVRPLEDETTWHANPLDSVDPDSLAQADPLHYKIATFMSYLDLLIARGDAAFRMLERDTLNEAKMWYTQALDLLGEESWLSQNPDWDNPTLKNAADESRLCGTQQALIAISMGNTFADSRTANSLTELFYPQQNSQLTGYWQVLRQRLFNLRHNLSIDGLPLFLPLYAASADPAVLLSATVNDSSGGSDLPQAAMPLYRFPIMLENARSLVNQLTQFGSMLLNLTERQDAEALSELLQTQGAELVLQSLAQQNAALAEVDADRVALEEARRGAQHRLESYTQLCDEDVNSGEQMAMDLALSSSVLSTTATASYAVAAGLDTAPNIYGMAFGGSKYGSIARAIGTGIEIGAAASRAAAERISQSEAYRRRLQEWEIQRDNARAEVKQIDAQLNSLAVRSEAANLQKTYMETQQIQLQAQMTFLQSKFTSKALYNWLRGKLSAIYSQFYDLTVSRCLMAQAAYRWELDLRGATFVRPGAWQGTHAGLMAGETLLLNLAQMEQAYLHNNGREKQVTKTVCLSEVYAFSLTERIGQLLNNQTVQDVGDNGLTLEGNQLKASISLVDLNIAGDYPAELGEKRRIRQISITLPALIGPYQDIRAILSYVGSLSMPQGCDAVVVSHGMNDSGQFQLDFNDNRWLPFEGIPVDNTGNLVLSFPDANDKQKELLLSLADIILHIRYSIC